MDSDQNIPERQDIIVEHTWDLQALFESDEAWEENLKKLESLTPSLENFRGTLGDSPETLRNCLDFMNEFEILEEKLGHYAYLKTSENLGDSDNQDRMARYMSVASKASALASYQTPEIQAIPDDVMDSFLADEILGDFVISLLKIRRFRPHVLSESEEKLLALQAEANQTANKSFSALTDVDLDFGKIDTPGGMKPLSQSSFVSFMIDPDRDIRKKAYFQFYEGFEKHKNTLAALYAGSVHLDIYRARVRNYNSSRHAALFPDRVPESVYDNLVATVNKNLSNLHEYYQLRKRILGIDTLKPYDVYVPMIKDIKVSHTYEKAVEAVISSLEPLGNEYCNILREGLLGRWVDRFENSGKRSGAFSYGTYTSPPYILMNFKEEVLRDVFTLAHEGGHSMHSYYSAKSNPFQHYNYTIFEAEVASTFNEQLLARYLTERAESDEMKAYLLGKQIDDIIGTIFRQTMFAEFESKTHSMVEEGGALTVDSLRSTYRELIERYFGGEMEFENVSDLEGLRIPHFYRAFYVYKYATGLSAAIALSKRVAEGGDKERDEYFSFLKSGGSRYPLESLGLAGVDMSSPDPVQHALDTFKSLVDQLSKLV